MTPDMKVLRKSPGARFKLTGIVLIALGLPFLGACTKTRQESSLVIGDGKGAQVTDPSKPCDPSFLKEYDALLEKLAEQESPSQLKPLREQVSAFRERNLQVKCTRPSVDGDKNKKPEIIFVAQETERALSVIDASLSLVSDGSDDER
jgi:hypothetical protein